MFKVVVKGPNVIEKRLCIVREHGYFLKEIDCFLKKVNLLLPKTKKGKCMMQFGVYSDKVLVYTFITEFPTKTDNFYEIICEDVLCNRRNVDVLEKDKLRFLERIEKQYIKETKGLYVSNGFKKIAVNIPFQDLYQQRKKESMNEIQFKLENISEIENSSKKEGDEMAEVNEKVQGFEQLNVVPVLQKEQMDHNNTVVQDIKKTAFVTSIETRKQKKSDNTKTTTQQISQDSKENIEKQDDSLGQYIREKEERWQEFFNKESEKYLKILEEEKNVALEAFKLTLDVARNKELSIWKEKNPFDESHINQVKEDYNQQISKKIVQANEDLLKQKEKEKEIIEAEIENEKRLRLLKLERDYEIKIEESRKNVIADFKKKHDEIVSDSTGKYEERLAEQEAFLDLTFSETLRNRESELEAIAEKKYSSFLIEQYGFLLEAQKIWAAEYEQVSKYSLAEKDKNLEERKLAQKELFHQQRLQSEKDTIDKQLEIEKIRRETLELEREKLQQMKDERMKETCFNSPAPSESNSVETMKRDEDNLESISVKKRRFLPTGLF